MSCIHTNIFIFTFYPGHDLTNRYKPYTIVKYFQSLINFFFFLLYFYRVRSRLWSVESTSTPLQASQANGHHSPVHRSLHSDFRDQAQNRSSIDSSPVCETLTPNASPCCADLDFVHRSGKSTPSRPSSNKSTRWPHFNLDEIDGVVPLGNFEPKNLLSLFEDSVHEEKLWVCNSPWSSVDLKKQYTAKFREAVCGLLFNTPTTAYLICIWKNKRHVKG